MLEEASLPLRCASYIHDTFCGSETLGGLNYVLKREGVIPSGPSFTVQLEVSYKKPVPAESTVICTASIESIEGRKAWAKATVQVSLPLPASHSKSLREDDLLAGILQFSPSEDTSCIPNLQFYIYGQCIIS